MRLAVIGLCATALSASTLVCPPAAMAVDIVGCSVEQTDLGEASCFYVALTNVGKLSHTEIEFDGDGWVFCDTSGSYAYRDTTGTTTFNQIPGELCHVGATVFNTGGHADVWGGSVV